jgi:hypothetical protein
MIVSITTFTLIHTLISLVAIVAGLTLLPSHDVGILSLVVPVPVILARYRKHLEGAWRGAYVVGSVLVLYLNVLVLVNQLFRRIPVLIVLAPTQREPPFVLTQLLVMALFVPLGVAAFKRFSPLINASAN